MATFNEDLARCLRYTASISMQRAWQWNTRRRPLLEWQTAAFESLISLDGQDSIGEAWEALNRNASTQEQASLLQQELRAIIEFQSPLVDLPYGEPEELEEELPLVGPRTRKQRPLKKAVGLTKTLLESLKEIFGDVLGVKGKIAIQIAIEAAEAFA